MSERPLDRREAREHAAWLVDQLEGGSEDAGSFKASALGCARDVLAYEEKLVRSEAKLAEVLERFRLHIENARRSVADSGPESEGEKCIQCGKPTGSEKARVCRECVEAVSGPEEKKP